MARACWGRPGRGENACLDGGAEGLKVGFCVGFEELRVKLAQDVLDACGFIGELDRKEGLEMADKLWSYFCMEGSHVGEGEEEACGLEVSQIMY